MSEIKVKHPEPAGVSEDVIQRAARVKVLLMDVDGVLTDGKLYYLQQADGKAGEVKGFNSHDGLGLHFCNRVGIKTGVISGRVSFATTERARILKMSYVYQDLLEKEGAYNEVLEHAQVDASEVCFVGDDFTDVPLMRLSGLGVAVQNARQELHEVADYVTEARGGEGAIREVVELILKAQGAWQSILEHYKLG